MNKNTGDKMTKKIIPFTKAQITALMTKRNTPFYIYDENEIVKNANKMTNAYSWVKGYKNYFAVKACPNPYILKILKNRGMGADCSSLPELLLAEKVGLSGEEIMFTSNDTPADEFIKARQLGAIINLDDISHIEYLQKTLSKENISFPELICFRYNPGKLKQGNTIIGNPEDAKYGLTREQLFEAYKKCQELGVRRFGLHTMVASNELKAEYHIETAKILFELVLEIKEKLNINIELINLGGGYGIPYKPDQSPIDYEEVSHGIKELYDKLIRKNNIELKIVMECGRIITGPYGYLVTEVRHLKNTYKNYVGTDACMSNLMRPGMYGAYHHITVLGKEDNEKYPLTETYDITGSLCENNDKFAIDRSLPKIEVGDVLVIHDVGAHGHAMGFQYNGKLRSAEFLMRTKEVDKVNNELLKKDGELEVDKYEVEFEEIRRAETVEDYFSTLDFDGLNDF